MEKRKIRQNRVSITGKFRSDKNEGVVDFESSLERDFYTILEFDKNVKSYTEQLIKVEYKAQNGAKRRYTPDVFIEFHNQSIPWLCEVKYRNDLRENFSNYKAKFKAARDFCNENGWKFVLITESIRNEYLENAQFLLKYKNVEPDFESEDHIIATIKSISTEGMFTAKQFVDSYGDTFMVKAIGLSILWRLLLREYILCDLHQRITMNTELWLNDELYGE